MSLDARFTTMMWLARRLKRNFRPDLTVEQMRRSYVESNRRYGLKGTTGVVTRELILPTSDAATIGARLYRPKNGGDGPMPVLVFFHGGGFVIGDVACYDGLTRYLAREGRIAVLSVDYRLGPEHPYPQAFEDAFDALRFVQTRAAEFGLDPERIAVGGDSAGGNLAASLASYAESRGLRRPNYAFLVYPAVDGSGRFPSRAKYRTDLPLTPEIITWFAGHFSPSAEESSALLEPIDAPHPERHCPTYLLAAQYDPLVDEGFAYAERLKAAGVAVTYDLRASLPHAFLNFAGVLPGGKKALSDGIRATARALGVRSVVALTGAGSGIGRALAVELAHHGYALALADRNEIALNETAAMLAGYTKVTTHLLDVSRRDDVDAFARSVLREHGRVDVAINNAGVALAGDVAELEIEEIAWLMDINFWGTVYGTKAFLPAMQRMGEGSIVNLSSVFGLFGPPGNSAYAASKFAVRGFSESLRAEVRDRGIHVLTVHPGGIKTNIARATRIAVHADQAFNRERARAFEENFLKETPERAAKAIVRGIVTKRDRVLIGVDAIQIDAITRILGPLGATVLNAMSKKIIPQHAAPPQAGAARDTSAEPVSLGA